MTGDETGTEPLAGARAAAEGTRTEPCMGCGKPVKIPAHSYAPLCWDCVGRGRKVGFSGYRGTFYLAEPEGGT